MTCHHIGPRSDVESEICVELLAC